VRKRQHATGKIAALCLGAAAWLAAAAAWAQVSIQSVSGSMQGGSEVVRVELSGPLEAEPTGFVVQTPARIALDLPGVTNATGQSRIDINYGNLRSINIAQGEDRARLVLNLKQATTYAVQREGSALLVVLESAPSGVPTNAQQSGVFEGQNAAGNMAAIGDVDFRRSSDGAGRVIVSLSNQQTGVDLRQEGGVLVVDFQRSHLPEALRRRLDVADFGTPVQTISTTQQGDVVRMRIQPVGDWEHSAYQSDSQFVVEVRQRFVDPGRLTQGQNFVGEKLSLNFQNIEVRALLQVIADFTDFNIVTSDTVTGALTLRLKDVPWDQALQIIMDSRGLGMRKNGTVLWIAPKDEIDERTRRDYEAAEAIRKLEPLRTQGFQLNYTKAEEVLRRIAATNRGGGDIPTTRFLSERGSAIAEPRTNQLFVTDTAAKLAEVQALLLTLDKPVRQVLIEARIVEADDTFGRALGVRLGGGDLRAQRGGDGGYRIGGENSNTRLGLGTNYGNAVATGGNGGTVEPLDSFVNLPGTIQGVSGGTGGSFAVSIFNAAANRFLALELTAMETEGTGKVISSPRLVTADQTKAMIEQGTEYPYTETAPNGATTVDFKKAVLKLEVTPQITPEGNIILDLDVNKDSRGEVTDQGIAIDTRHITTQVLVQNGGTVVIGGIFELEEREGSDKIPMLGDIPILGNLFKSRVRESRKREMLVFITPKMLAEVGGFQ